MWGISLRGDLFRKRIDQKNVLLEEQIGIVLADPWSAKYLFAPVSLLFRKSGGEKKRFTFQVYAIKLALQ